MEIGWEDYFTDERMLQNIEYFWDIFSQRFKDHQGLFAIDLSNEPHMLWEGKGRQQMWVNYLKEKYKTIDRLKSVWGNHMDTQCWDDIEIPADENKLNNPVLWDYQLFRNQLSRNFIERCVNAIKKNDTNHYITIGCHQGTIPFDGTRPSRYFGFDPHYVGDLLDYISLHWYPYNDDMDITDADENFEKNMALLMASLQYVHIGKPIILEEFGLYGGGIAPDFPWRKPFKYISQEKQADWVMGIIERSIGICSVWLNWGFKDHPEAKDPTRYQGFYDDDGNLKELGKRFIEKAPSLKELSSNTPHAYGKERIRLNLKELVTDGVQAQNYKKQCIEDFARPSDKKFEVIL